MSNFLTPGDATPYLNLITPEHADKPRFMATVKASVQPYADLLAAAQQMGALYDLDVAVGKQLDVVGEWVGASRGLEEPISGVFFSWDTNNIGWDQGIWQGPFDPNTGIVQLPDDIYRTLIRAKIAANTWDGTVPGAYATWDLLFGSAFQLLIQDFGNMTMAMGVITPNQALDPVTLSLLTSGALDLRPAGVQIVDYFTSSVPGQAVFAWDVDPPTQAEAGWDLGVWSVPLS